MPPHDRATLTWRDLISGLCPEAEFSLPATVREVAAEHPLGLALPRDLADLLAESDGVRGIYGHGLVWPTDRIVAENLAFRSNPDFRELYMPFDHLLFFGDAGNGDQFAFGIAGGAIRSGNVYAWDHETDGRACVAFSLRDYVEGRLSGRKHRAT